MNISLSEIFIVLVLAVLFLKPSDIPVIMQKLGGFYRKVLNIKDTFLQDLNPFSIEDDIEQDLKNNNKIIPENDK